MREHEVDFGLVSPVEAARALGVCPNTLQRWRAQSEGPRFVRVGHRIRYPWSSLAEYVQAMTVHVGEREVA